MEEIKPIIRVDVGESEQTVKGLKKEISELKDRILNLKKGSDDYNDAVEQLQASQRKLNEVMALTKKEAVAVEGSYDALTHQMSLLKKEWRATADEAKRAALGKQIDEINQQLKEMDASVGNFQRNVGNYVSHWEGMPEVAKDFGTAMKEANQTIEPTKQGLEGLGNLASGLASGFAAVQGAAALLGVENQKLEQTFIKLQAAIALAQGMSGMKGLVEGAGKLSAVLGVSVKTLGLWGAAIAAVGAGFYALFTNLPSYKKQQAAYDLQIKNSIEAQENFKKSVEKGNEALEKRVALLKAQGVEEKKIIQEQINDAKSDMDKGYKNYQQADEQYRSVKWRSETLTNGAFKSVYGKSKKDALEHYGNLRKEALDTYNTLKATYDGYVNDLNILNEKEKTAFQNRLKNMEEALKSEETKLKEQYEKDLANAEKYGFNTDIITKKYKADLKALREKFKNETIVGGITVELEDVKIEDVDIPMDSGNLDEEDKLGIYKTLADNRISYLERVAQRERDLNQASDLSDEEKAQKELEITQKLEEDKLRILQEFKQKAKEEGDWQSDLDLQQDIADQEVAITVAKNEKIIQSEQQRKEKTQKILSDVSAAISAAGQLTQGIMEIAQAKAEEDGEISEEEAKKIKGLQYATATINMLQGAITAFSSAMQLGPIIGPILGGVNAAAVIAMGTANLMRIKNTDLTGNVSSGPQAAVTPSSNVYGTDIPFSYTKQVTGASEIDALNQDTRVYILESDIQESNKKVQVRESESSF